MDPIGVQKSDSPKGERGEYIRKAAALRTQECSARLRVGRRRLFRLVRSRRVGSFAGSASGLRCSRVWRGRVLRVFIPAAGAHLLDRAAQFVVEGATSPGIVAQAVEFIPDALGFRIRSV
jgi:hypothetical protein